MKIFGDEIRALIAAAYPASELRVRDMNITLRLYGWDGGGGCSLQQAGDEFGLTRERVRQISKAFASELIPLAHQHLTTVQHLVAEISRLAPASAHHIEFLLKDQGLGLDRLEGVLKAASLFFEGHKDIRVVQEADARLVILPSMEGLSLKINAHAQKACTHLGAVNIESLLYLVPGLTTEKGMSFIRDVLAERPDTVWLDPHHTWAWLKKAPRNRLITCLHKMLSVFSSTTVESVIAGTNRYFRKTKDEGTETPTVLTAPVEVIHTLINHWGQASCSEDGRVRKTPRFRSNAKLTEFEKGIVDMIWATPEKICREKTLENALVPLVDEKAHPKKHSFSNALNYSPLIAKGNHRGEYIANGVV
jgi:hypothetical protein